MKQSAKTIKAELAKLRAFIEDNNSDDLLRRLAQVAEEALLWATEDTVGWETPVENIAVYGRIIRSEL